MQKTILELPAISLVGLAVRTNNHLEQDANTAKIGPTIQRYFQSQISGKIKNRKSPGVLYCVYTDYESDMMGVYTYFVGEVGDAFDGEVLGGRALVIPAQAYVKFTAGPDKMPAVCIRAWQKIWGMSKSELSGERAYIADFEIYDARSYDPKNTELDIYIGIQ